MPSPKKSGQIGRLPDRPRTIAEYAQHHANVALDPKLTSVSLDTTLGKELVSIVDGYRVLVTAVRAYVPRASTPENLRTILRETLTHAIAVNRADVLLIREPDPDATANN